MFIPFLQPELDDSWQISGRFKNMKGFCCSVEFQVHDVALRNLPSSIPLDSSIGYLIEQVDYSSLASAMSGPMDSFLGFDF
jgi:hypothetical protein